MSVLSDVKKFFRKKGESSFSRIFQHFHLEGWNSPKKFPNDYLGIHVVLLKHIEAEFSALSVIYNTFIFYILCTYIIL
jgi:hypothetical protein